MQVLYASKWKSMDMGVFLNSFLVVRLALSISNTEIEGLMHYFYVH